MQHRVLFLTAIFATLAICRADPVTQASQLVGQWYGTCQQAAGVSFAAPTAPVCLINATLSYNYTITYTNESALDWFNGASANVTQAAVDYYVPAGSSSRGITYNVSAPGFVTSSEGSCYNVDIVTDTMIEYGQYNTTDGSFVAACPTNSSRPVECGATYFYLCTLTRVAAPVAAPADAPVAAPTDAAPVSAPADAAPVAAPVDAAPTSAPTAAAPTVAAPVAAPLASNSTAPTSSNSTAPTAAAPVAAQAPVAAPVAAAPKVNAPSSASAVRLSILLVIAAVFVALL